MNETLGLAPFGVLVLGAAVLLGFDRVFRADERVEAWLAASFAVAAAATAALLGTGDDALGGSLRRDGATVFLTSLLCASAAAAFLLHAGVADEAMPGAGLAGMLVGTAGAALLVAAAHLILLFVALEILFIAVLALIAGASSSGTRSASRSFFVLCGSASALLAAGVGLVWSEGGSFAIGALAALSSPAGEAGVALVLVGLACFAGLAPLHFWLLPALTFVPAPAAAFIAVVPRVAAFAALMRCASAISATDGSAIDWRACVAVLAAASLAVGSVGAVTETSLRRLVGHLAVAYGGVIGIAAAAGVGASPAIGLALLGYAVIVVGLIAVVALVPAVDAQLDDLRGVARRRPLLVAALAVLAIGMAGLPPTMGFFARLAVFEAAVDARLAWLVVVATITSVVVAASGLRMAFACLEAGKPRLSSDRIVSGVVALTALIALAGGIAPGPWLQLAQTVRF